MFFKKQPQWSGVLHAFGMEFESTSTIVEALKKKERHEDIEEGRALTKGWVNQSS